MNIQLEDLNNSKELLQKHIKSLLKEVQEFALGNGYCNDRVRSIMITKLEETLLWSDGLAKGKEKLLYES